jgi:hypothetical protein
MPNELQAICSCGKSIPVTAGQAGGNVTCACGASVEVPSLMQLKRAAGMPVATPELALIGMLANGEVPGDRSCCACGAETASVWKVHVACEKMEKKGRGLRFNPFGLLFGVIGILLTAKHTEVAEHGRDVNFDLPLRFCSKCAATCRGKELRQKLEAVEEYRRLVEKYPHATVGPPIPVSHT